MKIFITTISLLMVQFTFGQTAYEKAMAVALSDFQTGKAEEAIPKFERISAAEKDAWIPAYYQALASITSSFQISDVNQKKSVISRVNSLIKEREGKGSKSEWLVLKAMALTVEMTTDPMNLAMKLSPQIMGLYKAAIEADVNNPRALYGLAEFGIQSKRFMGGSIEKECEDLRKALSLFGKELSKEAFYPTWGKERVEQLIEQCSK